MRVSYDRYHTMCSVTISVYRYCPFCWTNSWGCILALSQSIALSHFVKSCCALISLCVAVLSSQLSDYLTCLTHPAMHRSYPISDQTYSRRADYSTIQCRARSISLASLNSSKDQSHTLKREITIIMRTFIFTLCYAMLFNSYCSGIEEVVEAIVEEEESNCAN